MRPKASWGAAQRGFCHSNTKYCWVLMMQVLYSGALKLILLVEGKLETLLRPSQLLRTLIWKSVQIKSKSPFPSSLTAGNGFRNCKRLEMNKCYTQLNTVQSNPVIQGVQDRNLPKEMIVTPSILVQIEKFLCHNSFLIKTILFSL